MYEFGILLVFAMGIVAAAVIIAAARGGERRQRLRLLENALRDGATDAASRDELVRVLLGHDRPPHWRRLDRRFGGFGRLTFVAGWVTVILSLGLFATGECDTVAAGVFLLIFGLGVVALPMVLREYDERIGRADS